ncbi:MAG: hypothetical protein QOE96_4100, partial [Blastocatellia bacterium]|nr:hypothetical protein [Blastocatellia bacterium]
MNRLSALRALAGRDARAPSRDLLQFAVRNHILIQIRDLEQAFPK